MNTLVIVFSTNGTIRKATIRHNGKEVPDMAIDEVWQFYEILVLLGHEPVELEDGDALVHMIVY